ncbi:MAG TPA: hypothetical protein VFI84_02685 [Candidatus Saccharimonadales bacterium]|nr:hypothetical protein [Candidatus Saccharimonadales bacterium]
MDKLYRFSPIADKQTFDTAWQYIGDQLPLLAQKVIGEELPLTTVKVFAHYPEEYDVLKTLMLDYGQQSQLSSDTSLYVDVDLQLGNSNIKALGIRVIDPYRSQVGCGDYAINDYKSFKEKFLLSTNPFIREIVTPKITMTELWHPDFDILGYVVKA